MSSNKIVQRLDRDREASRAQAAATPRWSISPCWNCSPTCAPTDSKPSSSPAAASNSCALDGEGLRHSARASHRQQRPDKVRNAGRQARADEDAGDRIRRRQGRQTASPSKVHRPPAHRWRSGTPTATCKCSMDRGWFRSAICLYIHHTDADREWAYDRESPTAVSTRALDEAAAKGWTVVSMKNDWKRVFDPPIGAGSCAGCRGRMKQWLIFADRERHRHHRCAGTRHHRRSAPSKPFSTGLRAMLGLRRRAPAARGLAAVRPLAGRRADLPACRRHRRDVDGAELGRRSGGWPPSR